jgi:hypothetical protein
MGRSASIATATSIISDFIRIAGDLEKLPKLSSPQYKQAAKSLSEICGLLRKGNKKVADWIYRFRYQVDFLQDANQARTTFLAAAQDYKTLRSDQMDQLTLTCHDIRRIYYNDIEPKLGELLEEGESQKKAKQVFEELSHVDNDWLDFVRKELIWRLGTFADNTENQVRAHHMDAALKSHLKFIEESTEVSKQLDEFHGALTKLMDRFADIAGTPVTLSEHRDE